jgi:hypothetical protein
VMSAGCFSCPQVWSGTWSFFRRAKMGDGSAKAPEKPDIETESS